MVQKKSLKKEVCPKQVNLSIANLATEKLLIENG